MRVRFAGALLASVLAQSVLLGNASEGYRLVANPAVAARNIARTEASRIFLKKTGKWPDGSTVVPVDQPTSSKTRESFSRDVHGKDAAAIDAYWQKQVFSGTALPPVVMASDGEVLRYVRATPGAVGYVSPETDVSGLRPIEVQ